MRWNDQEDEALLGLPLLARVVYLQGLLRFMDYQTGVVGGPKRRISWQALAEVAEVVTRQGMRGEHATKGQLRRAMAHLESAGLVRQHNDERYLMFFLPLADTVGKSGSKKGHTTSVPPGRTASVPPESSVGQGKGEQEKEKSVPSVLPNPVPHQLSVKDLTTSACAAEAATPKATTKSKKGNRLPSDWSPSDALLVWTKKERPSWDETSMQRVIDSFRDYWTAKPGQSGIKLDWDATWRNWVRREPDRVEKRYITTVSTQEPVHESAAETARKYLD
ncbi:MAG: hypothetical protein KKD63_04655 [Proteobacteria bacterium]|nr:hypothetical protein [Desulfobulbaceae bacterium]MBU4152153.1 hypothetical protein [Pseudomonadota bacterium]